MIVIALLKQIAFPLEVDINLTAHCFRTGTMSFLKHKYKLLNNGPLTLERICRFIHF